MLKCVNDNCDYFNVNGECSSACEHNGYKKILTNADRIHSMNDEELKALLFETYRDGYETCSEITFGDEGTPIKTDLYFEDWLKQPAESIHDKPEE